jgi:hypothetical protein
MAHVVPRGDQLASWVVAIAVAGAAIVVGTKRTARSEKQDSPPTSSRAAHAAAAVPAAAEAPSESEAPADAVKCDSYAATSNDQMCLLAWGRCSDGQPREVRCVNINGRFECDCVVGASTLSSFTSPDFCVLGGAIPSVSQATLTEAATVSCGWPSFESGGITSAPP